ncbi:pilus assembly protein PilP [Vibrio neptunius]|uniref:pilus assembly protein PilP n=1 Tax=Vibrio neptunius TaxID=170651 RepID=UPI0006990ABE|nr:pilus assembly protein PilP [Vibrio neptunius]
MRTKPLVFLLIALSGCKANQHPLVLSEARQSSVASSKKLGPHLFSIQQNASLSMSRDPFSLPAISKALVSNSSQCDERTGIVADNQSTAHPQLRLAGIMTIRGEHAALIELPNGSLITKTRGQSVANNRLITDISTDALELRESVLDGVGCVVYRNIKLVIN